MHVGDGRAEGPDCSGMGSVASMLVAMGQGPILIGLGRALRCFKTVLGRAPMRVAVSQGVILF